MATWLAVFEETYTMEKCQRLSGQCHTMWRESNCPLAIMYNLYCYYWRSILSSSCFMKQYNTTQSVDSVKLGRVSSNVNRPCCNWQMCDDVLLSHRLAENTNCLLFRSYTMTAKRAQMSCKPLTAPPAAWKYSVNNTTIFSSNKHTSFCCVAVHVNL